MWSSVKQQGKGGHFSPSRNPVAKPKSNRKAERQAAFESKEKYDQVISEYQDKVNKYNDGMLNKRPEVKIVKTQEDDVNHIVSLYHELGHAVDYDGAETSQAGVRSIEGYRSGFASIRAAMGLNEPGLAEMRELFDQAYQTKTMQDFCRRKSKDWMERGYSVPSYEYTEEMISPIEIWVWTFNQWSAKTLGHDHVFENPSYGMHNFSDGEIDELSPLIEIILDKRGLLV